MEPRTANGWWATAVIAVAHLAAALLAFDPTPQAGGDNAAYRALAEALATGRGYVRLWEPGHPAEVLYPPAFPFLLAGAERLGATSFAALQLLMVPLSVACVCCMFFWLRRTLRPLPAFTCGMVIALSPGVLGLSHELLSDVPFAALSALAIGAYASVDDKRSGRQNVAWITLAIGATVLANFTRSAGLPLILAALVWLLWRKRTTAAIALLAVVGPLALMWRARGAGTASYTDYLRFVDPYQPQLGRVDGLALMMRMLENGDQYASRHLPTLLFGTDAGFAVLGGWVVVALAVIGFSRRVRAPSIAEFWMPLYVGLLLLWPQDWSGERLLYPLYPVILAYVAEALPIVRARVPKAVLLVLIVAAALGITVGDARRITNGLGCMSLFRRGVEYPCVDGGWRDFFDVSRSIRGRLPEGSVVLARKPTIFYAEAGYASAVFPLSVVPDTLFTEARRIGARYVMVDGSALTSMYVFDVLRAHPSRFCSLPAFRRNLASLLRIEPEHQPVLAVGDTTAIVDCKPE